MELQPITEGTQETKKVTLLGLDELNPANNLEKKSVSLDPIDVNSRRVLTLEGQVPSATQRLLGDNYHPEFDQHYIQKQLAAKQTGGEQLVNTLASAAIGEIGGGYLKDIGYLLGGPSMLSKDSEDNIGKAFIDLGQKAQEYGDKTFPLFKDPDSKKFDPSSWAWWLQNAKGMASIIPATTLAYGAAAIGAPVIGAIAEGLGLTEAGVSGVAKALTSRQIYNMMFAHGTYQEVYNNALERKMSEADAVKKASIAASDSYKKMWALLPLDIAQYKIINDALRNTENIAPSYAWSKMMNKPTEEAIEGVNVPSKLGALGKEIYIVCGQLVFKWKMSEE